MRTRSDSPAEPGHCVRPLHSARVGVLLLCMSLLISTAANSATVTLDFNTMAVGSVPADFSTALTGRGSPGVWRITTDTTAPNGSRVLGQTSTDKTSARFPLCVYERLTATDVTVSVQFKAVSGTVDQAAGLVARYQDKNNYYIVRANALEHNVRLYTVARGERKQFAGVNITVPTGQWQHLSLEVKGSHFRVFFNDALLFEADDTTFRNAGKVGLWTKADSVTYFADLTMTSPDAP